MSLALKFGPWILLAVMTVLYLGKRDEIIEVKARAETDKALAIAAAEKLVSKAVQAAADRRIAQVEAMALDAANARNIAETKAMAANESVIEASRRIRDLELEASIDEIPDSNECLNVYVPYGVLYSDDCAETGNRGSGNNKVCPGAGEINEADSSFANVTYSDAMIRWLQDRAGLLTCNGQLEAIESLYEN